MPSPDPRLVKGQIPYGAEYWFTPATAPSEMRADFEQMRSMGFNTLRIFTGSCEVAPDVYDYTQIDALFSTAADLDLTVCPTFTLSLPPWREQAIGLDPSLRVPLPFLLDDPAFRAQLEPGLSRLVRRCAASPALWSWILWNEPSRPLNYPAPPPVWAGFRRWVEREYTSDFAGLLSAWYPEGGSHLPSSFSEIGPRLFLPSWSGLWQGSAYQSAVPPAVLTAAGKQIDPGWMAYPFLRDWLRYQMHALTDSIRWLADLVRASDPIHPTHINPDGFFQNQVQSGRSLPDLARAVDIFGSSLHPGHHFSYLRSLEEFPEALSFYTASIAAANKDGFSLVTELQAGPNTWSGNKNFTPDSNDLALWSLTALGSGLKGILYWLWKPRANGWEAGEWGLMHQDGSPTLRSAGAAKIGQFLRDHSAWFAALKPASPRVAILLSPETDLQGMLEGFRSPLPAARFQTLSTYGCFRALHRRQVPAAFVTPTGLAAGVGDIRCLLVPYGEVLDGDTAQAIVKFARQGGWVYVETPFGMKAPGGSSHPVWPGHGLDQVFTRALDIWPASKTPILQTPLGPLHTELFVQPLASGDHEVIAELEDGYDVIIERAVGQGRVLFVGTCLSLYIAAHPEAQDEEALIASFAQRSGGQPSWQLLSPASGVAVSLLESPPCDALVVTNFSDEEREIKIRLARTYAQVDGFLGYGEVSCARRLVSFTLPPRSGEVIRLTPR